MIQSSLGYLINPYHDEDEEGDWIIDFWRVVANGRSFDQLQFANQPAVRRLGVTSPEVLKRFATFNKGKSYAEQIKPFNFMLTVSEHVFFKASEIPRSLIAPFEPNPSRWYEIPWIDYHTGETVQVVTLNEWQQNAQTNCVHPSTFGFLFSKYVKHPAPDLLACDGSVCEEDTIGILLRRPVSLLALSHIGKETDELANELAHSGLKEDQPVEYSTDYAIWRNLIIPALQVLSVMEIVQRLKVTPRTRERWIKGETLPETQIMQKVAVTLNLMVEQAIRQLGLIPLGDLTSNIPAFLEMFQQRNKQLQSALVKFENEYGLRQGASLLQLSPPTLRAYTKGYLPRESSKKAMLAEKLINTIAPVSVTADIKKKSKPRILTLVSVWEALENYSSV